MGQAFEMPAKLLKTSFSAGEVSPALFGRVDLAPHQNGCSVARNMFVNTRGGISSRAGTAWVGPAKQAVSSGYPPRLIPFRFSISQGYALEFGDSYMRVISQGAYVVDSSATITGATKANPCVLSIANSWAAGDLIYVSAVGGMTQLNGRFFLIASRTGTTVTLNDIFGNAVDSTGYTTFSSNGLAGHVYTVASPYAAVDLPYLKHTQSADVMSLRCVNQATGTEYPPYDLARVSATSWTFTQTTYGSNAVAPASISLAASSGSATTYYSYGVTTVLDNGDESILSPVAYIEGVDIAQTAGSITMTWPAAANASYYNLYKAPPSYQATLSGGQFYGYCGSSYGTSFTDSNIVQDQSQTPPLHQNPYARGALIQLNKSASGSGYTQASVTYSISTSTGSGAVLAPIVVGGDVTAVVVVNGGQNYRATDTVSFGGGGSGAHFNLVVGPLTGTYPSVVGYFQSRRVDANTLNNPDTLFLTKTGQFQNMDAASPPNDNDAIVTTPWGTQVNGIQWLISMPGGMIAATGVDCWQVTGSGGAYSAITPNSQSAQAQEAYGFSATVEPKKIGWSIIYLTPYNAVRELEYNFFANIYGGRSLSFLSNHLFINYNTVEWAWSQEPNQVLWAVRNDGKLLSLSFLKEQKIEGWCRHDTNGLFQSVCAVSEPPVDAIYFVVQRYIPGPAKWMYYIERMDDRFWDQAENCWCVDAGLSYQQNMPAATLTITLSNGGTTANVTASSAVFSNAAGNGAVHDVIRVDGGKLQVSAYNSTTSLTCNVLGIVTMTMPNDPNGTPVPAPSQSWSIAAPSTTLTNLDYLNGFQVSCVADGVLVYGDGIVAPSVTVTNGSITLPWAASNIVIGLPFTAQIQGLHADIKGPATESIQGDRKKISTAKVRLDRSRGITMGANQPIASNQPFQAEIAWSNMQTLQQSDALANAGIGVPLFSGDAFVVIDDDWSLADGQPSPGMVALQQTNPFPMNILGYVSDIDIGDA